MGHAKWMEYNYRSLFKLYYKKMQCEGMDLGSDAGYKPEPDLWTKRNHLSDFQNYAFLSINLYKI